MLWPNHFRANKSFMKDRKKLAYVNIYLNLQFSRCYIPPLYPINQGQHPQPQCQPSWLQLMSYYEPYSCAMIIPRFFNRTIINRMVRMDFVYVMCVSQTQNTFSFRISFFPLCFRKRKKRLVARTSGTQSAFVNTLNTLNTRFTFLFGSLFSAPLTFGKILALLDNATYWTLAYYRFQCSPRQWDTSGDYYAAGLRNWCA